jgi:MFS transporter, DHA3 family, tetracycline resistance protein
MATAPQSTTHPRWPRLWRGNANPLIVYSVLQFCSAGTFSLIFTVNGVYHLVVARLNPFQLVLTGTILETVIFLGEIPTGVLADTKGRRLSIVIGYCLVGLGFLIEGLFANFGAIAAAQVVWGLGFTFTSGATQAWIADEVGPERAGDAFVRGAQAERWGSLLAIPLGILLGKSAVALPVVAGGICFVALAGFLALYMGETGFVRDSAAGGSNWSTSKATLRGAGQLLRRQPTLLTLLGIGWFYGLYSEGLDRLYTAHLWQDMDLPTAVTDAVLLFGAVRAVQLLLTLMAGELVQRREVASNPRTIARILPAMAAGIVIALAGFAWTRNLWVALCLSWLISVLRNLSYPLFDAWFNTRIKDPHVRATLFSTTSQVDAIGQICGGPLAGAVGQRVSVRAALLLCSTLLAPVLPLYSVARRQSAYPEEA